MCVPVMRVTARRALARPGRTAALAASADNVVASPLPRTLTVLPAADDAEVTASFPLPSPATALALVGARGTAAVAALLSDGTVLVQSLSGEEQPSRSTKRRKLGRSSLGNGARTLSLSWRACAIAAAPSGALLVAGDGKLACCSGSTIRWTRSLALPDGASVTTLAAVPASACDSDGDKALAAVGCSDGSVLAVPMEPESAGDEVTTLCTLARLWSR